MNYDKNISPERNSACSSVTCIRRLQRADPISQSDDGRVSRNGALPGRQADSAEIYLLSVFPVLHSTRPRSLLWRNFWDSRATGTFCSNPTPSRHSILPWIPRKWQPRHCLHRVQAFTAEYRPFFELAWARARLISSFHTIPRRSVQRPGALRCSVRTSAQFD